MSMELAREVYHRQRLLATISSEIGRKCARDSKFSQLWNGFTRARRSEVVSKMLVAISLLEAIKGESNE